MSTITTSDAYDYQQGVQSEPLKPEEIKLLNRLLSDPTVYPKAFKQWVTDHSSDTVDISKSQVHGLISNNGAIIITAQSWEQLGAAFCPMILPYPIATPPNNWLRCDGAFYAESQFPTLFSFLGHTHDPFASTGSFAVPDLRGRTIYGYDPDGRAGAPGNTMYVGFHDDAAQGGRGPYHRHRSVVTTPVNVGVQLAPGSTYVRYSNQDLDYYTQPVAGGGSYPINDSGGFYVLNYIIASGRTP